jgi:hypothetical protein
LNPKNAARRTSKDTESKVIKFLGDFDIEETQKPFTPRLVDGVAQHPKEHHNVIKQHDLTRAARHRTSSRPRSSLLVVAGLKPEIPQPSTLNPRPSTLDPQTSAAQAAKGYRFRVLFLGWNRARQLPARAAQLTIEMTFLENESRPTIASPQSEDPKTFNFTWSWFGPRWDRTGETPNSGRGREQRGERRHSREPPPETSTHK